MLDVKPMKTPLATHFWLSTDLTSQTEEEEKYMPCTLYTSAVESIIYAMLCTRPYISLAINVLSWYMDKLGKGH